MSAPTRGAVIVRVGRAGLLAGSLAVVLWAMHVRPDPAEEENGP